jgi:hypothetical protein
VVPITELSPPPPEPASSVRIPSASIDPDEYYMALGRVSHTHSATTSPTLHRRREVNPALNLPPRPLPSVEEFKEIQSLSDMLEVVQQDSDLNRLRI